MDASLELPHWDAARRAAPRAQARWPQRIGLVNDYVRIPFANGSSFASQFLYREFRARGHRVTVVGPADPLARAHELPEHYVLLKSLPLRSYPGVRLPFPSRTELAEIAAQRFDFMLTQASSALVELGVWLRLTHGVPNLVVNTQHLRSSYNVLFPDRMLANPLVREFFEERVLPWVESHSAEVYNQTDGLIVLSEGLANFWRERGVRVPIHVIPRAVDPTVFDRVLAQDPFDPSATRGYRLVVVCRQTREKSVARLIRLFAEQVAPQVPQATLTLVGDGPDRRSFERLAARLGVGDRIFFMGEASLSQVPAFYQHADLFVYASLSETYGQVVTEAMWCGLPVVAFADGMGVSGQVRTGHNGVLLDPGPSEPQADAAFGAAVVRLLSQPAERRALGRLASEDARRRAHPAPLLERYYDAFSQSREHCLAALGPPRENPLRGLSVLGRWTSVQALAVGLGQLRAPPMMKPTQSKQAGW